MSNSRHQFQTHLRWHEILSQKNPYLDPDSTFDHESPPGRFTRAVSSWSNACDLDSVEEPQTSAVFVPTKMAPKWPMNPGVNQRPTLLRHVAFQGDGVPLFWGCIASHFDASPKHHQPSAEPKLREVYELLRFSAIFYWFICASMLTYSKRWARPLNRGDWNVAGWFQSRKHNQWGASHRICGICWVVVQAIKSPRIGSTANNNNRYMVWVN